MSARHGGFERWIRDEEDRRHAAALDAALAAQPEAFFEHSKGRLVLVGTRIDARQVRALLAGGLSAEDVAEHYGLSAEQVEAARAFSE